MEPAMPRSVMLLLEDLSSWAGTAFAMECPKIKVGTCKDCIQSGPGCAWCKKPVGPHNLSCCQPPEVS
uniref:Integrin beta N-terminal domain-containing protein n=1 Tax=Calidris pygmaea TaxID=425635 RepID=A0A8C3PML0_9CHAR